MADFSGKDASDMEFSGEDANDVDYHAAVDSLRTAIERFAACSEEERRELQHDLDALERMAEKLESGRVELVVFGEISTGKSSLNNALVGEELCQVNVPCGWTYALWHVP